ncbi:calcium-translocating P-type ATPase, PMCA-type [Candidatus Woesearchaeota archaeon]|nr:calcium-translocating P-type ATPase, PMCA-type [Candidatus Woesearchaeota archaeon]
MHHKKLEDVFKELETDENGLTEKEAEARLKKYGLNEIQQLKKISPIKIFINQFNNIVIYILIFALAVSIFLNETIDAIVIGVIVIVNAIIGFIQEYRAEKAIEALKKLAGLRATVRREGKEKEIDAKLLVPGDIVKLETGDKIPADCRLIDVTELQTQEATLTGESTPIKKEISVLAEKTPLADRLNMTFSGTIITNGKAHAVITATGMQTEIGKIATLIEEIKPDLTPLQKKLNTLGKKLGIVVIIISIIVFLTQLFKNPAVLGYLTSFQFLEFLKGSREIFLTAIALAVAAIPEGLPVVVTVGLAIGIKRMVKRNALNRRLPSVETLGSTTVICTDKTGTLTKNEMTVTKIYANGKIIDVTGSGYDTEGEFLSNNKKVNLDELKLLLKIGALNNDASFDKENVIGDPTEAALLVSAAKSGVDYGQLRKKHARKHEIPFTSERKIMTTIHDMDGDVAYVKGAPEVVLKLCNSIYVNGAVRELKENEKKNILQTNADFAGNALRVLGFAFKAVTDESRAEKNLTFVGLQAMIDPPREEVKEAIEKCKKAGIKIVVITGDHEETAKAIAKEIGIEGISITGSHLEKMSQEELDKEVEDIVLYARVNPEHKIKIVNALKKKGHVVAMTGDGVNDAPALKKADIGIAMGITGTDVAKEASDTILLDDNFASIVNAVEEGRGVYGNIRKYFSYLISGNIGEVFIIFLSIMFGWPAALTATQILLINLVTDGLPAVALSSDPYEPNAMSRKPRNQKDPIYKDLQPFIIYYPSALIIAALSVFYYFNFIKGNLIQAQTATFLTVAMFELYQAFACRSTIYPAIKVGLFKNKWLILAVLSSFALIITSIFIPSFGSYLDMVPITFMEFIAIVALSSIGAVIIEISKHLKSRNEQLEY